MKCSHCQFENREDAKFCNECGSRLECTCLECGKVNPHGSKFCDECGCGLAEVSETPEAVPAFEGERKHITVLFSDLSGYTALTERLDPEEVKAIMSRIFGEIAQIVTKYEGFIERFFGDEVMALFGVPEVHEDDPVRAIRAAVEIQHVMEEMSPEYEARVGCHLAMHIGISTGLVITGDEYIGKGRHGLTGDTVNLGARLAKLAPPGEILVGLDTYRQAEGYFTFESMEPTQVKGKEQAVCIYKVLSPKEQPTKVHRTHGVRADLIGRKMEMAQLGEAVERLREGESTVISISGSAGTGKSRLVEEFKATLDLEEIQWREAHAYSYAQNIPYYPLVDMLNRAWQIDEGDPPETVKGKLESSIEYLIGEKEDVIPYVGSLYSLSYPEIEGVSPEFWKTRLHQAIQEILSALAQRAPTIICLEDLHWADPSSLDLLRFVFSEFRHPALFLLVYRPYFSLYTSHQISALDKSYQEIRLQDLSASEAQNMTESLLKTNTIPSDLQRFILEKVEGNPFYLEEVINALIESGTLIRDNDNWRLARSMGESGISPTIHGVISGRLDRLEKETKRILQEASVVGRAFLYEILKRVTELKGQIDRCLNGLERLDLIRTRSLQPELEYVFKHALTQEVVYNGLLKKERRAIHERIGRVMERLFQDRLSEFHEALAFHFKLGLSVLKAVDYLVKSGEKALRRYAVEESHQYFKEAFELLAKKTDKTKEEEGLLIDVLNQWAYVFHHRGDFRGLAEILSVHEGLAESLDDKTRLGMFYVWKGVALFCRERHKEGYEYLRKALKLGEAIKNQKVVGYACSWLTYTCAELSLIEEGKAFGERAQEIAGALPSDQYLYFNSVGGLGYVHFHRGEGKKAFERAQDLLDYGQKHSNTRSLVLGHWIMGFGYVLDGDFQSCIECCKRAIQVSQDPWYSQLPRILLGAIYVYYGKFEEAEEVLKVVLTYSQKYGGEAVGTPANTYLGAALIGKGYMGQGLEMIEEAQRLYLGNERKGYYALSEYILGRLYLQIVEGGPRIGLSTVAKNIGFLMKNVPFAGKKAESHFNKAIEAAKEIGAKGTMGPAYLDLGRLHRAKDRREQARECISTSIALFEECEAEGYLKQAREALASLG
ncbi:MAG: AAA family ATPase [Thermodesulfobacteriota bacterium]|nr:AAA family ATPase [Thermodesulfobacteriota bacterium]